MSGTTHILKSGTILSHQSTKYTIQEVIGSGGFGITYKATYEKEIEIEEQFRTIKTTATVSVAIKELFLEGKCIRESDATVGLQSLGEHDFQGFKERFLREAQTLSQFNHEESILHVNAFFEANNTAYMVTEFVEGETLTSKVKRTGSLTENQAVKYISQMCKGLSKVHDQSILHKDIKPDNVIITPENNAVLIDFGAAREYVADKSLTQSVILTHGYAPLEQYSQKRRKGPYTDIHAIGGTLYYMLTGKTPPSIYDRNQGEALEIVNVSEKFKNIVNKAMELEPKKRFQTCEQLLAAVKNDDFKYHQNLERATIHNHLDKFEKSTETLETKKRTKDSSNFENDSKNGNKPKKRAVITLIIALVILTALSVHFFKQNENPWKEAQKVEKESEDYLTPTKSTPSIIKPIIQVQSKGLNPMYMNCGNELYIEAPTLGAGFNPEYSIKGGDIFNGTEKGKITIVPKTSKVELTVSSNGNIVGTKEFLVKEVPSPEIRVYTDQGEVNLKDGIPINTRNLYLRAIPDQKFMDFFPNEALFLITKSEATLTSDGHAILSSLGDKKINLSSIASKTRKGDLLTVEIKQMQRRNFQGKVEVFRVGSKEINIPFK